MQWWQQTLLVHVFRTWHNAGSFYLEFLLPLRWPSGLYLSPESSLCHFPQTQYTLVCYYCYPLHDLRLIHLSHCVVLRLLVEWSASHTTQWALYTKYVEQSKYPINNCFHLIEFSSEKVAPLASSSPSARLRILLMGWPISSALRKQSSKHWERR